VSSTFIAFEVSQTDTSVDEMYKGGSSTIGNVTNPNTAHSEEPNETPLNDYFKNNLSLFEWYEQPGNQHRLERFGIAMDAGRNAVPPDLILQGKDAVLQPPRSC
jgi:hypothetical protein